MRHNVPGRPSPLQQIPQTAKLAFEGRLFGVYQWEQLLFNGTTTVFEALRRPDTAYVIPVLADGTLLVAWQRQPPAVKRVYGLIGGRIEDGESPSAAAIRELREEAGLVANELTPWEAFQFLPRLDWAIYTFIARGCVTMPASQDAGEDIELVKVSFEDLLELAASEEFVDVEVALRLLRIAASPAKRRLARALFSP